MLEVNALISAQSKSIAAETRFHRRAEDSRQHSNAELDLSAGRFTQNDVARCYRCRDGGSNVSGIYLIMLAASR